MKFTDLVDEIELPTTNVAQGAWAAARRRMRRRRTAVVGASAVLVLVVSAVALRGAPEPAQPFVEDPVSVGPFVATDFPADSDKVRSESNLPARVTEDDVRADAPRLFDEPIEQAVLVAATVYDFDERGYDDQRITFYGTDGETRSLVLSDLGLTQDEFQGVDGSGLGNLSPDGRRWVFATTKRIVVLRLADLDVVSLPVPDGLQPINATWTGAGTITYGVAEKYSLTVETDLDGSVTRRGSPPSRVFRDRDGRVYRFQSDETSRLLISEPGGAEVSLSYSLEDGEFGPGAINPPGLSSFVDDLGDDTDFARDDGDSALKLFKRVDDRLVPTARLQWGDRLTGDEILGMPTSDSVLIRHGEDLCLWAPFAEQAITCLAEISDRLGISVAFDVVRID
ncbi:hypothetical protein GCM10027020_04730 [Nocardioides salsibiostraticola]